MEDPTPNKQFVLYSVAEIIVSLIIVQIQIKFNGKLKTHQFKGIVSYQTFLKSSWCCHYTVFILYVLVIQVKLYFENIYKVALRICMSAVLGRCGMSQLMNLAPKQLQASNTNLFQKITFKLPPLRFLHISKCYLKYDAMLLHVEYCFHLFVCLQV